MHPAPRRDRKSWYVHNFSLAIIGEYFSRSPALWRFLYANNVIPLERAVKETFLDSISKSQIFLKGRTLPPSFLLKLDTRAWIEECLFNFRCQSQAKFKSPGVTHLKRVKEPHSCRCDQLFPVADTDLIFQSKQLLKQLATQSLWRVGSY